ncbi:hypothetical protein P22_0142 [Propionispora sp. 2/2-37]|nr:hypothetical protein P22_0142 [Propionispora sp. 2/2-37]
MPYHLFCPNMKVDSVSDIKPELFKQRGIRGLVFDLDNTILPWGGARIPEDISVWFSRLKAEEFSFCLVSNSYEKRVCQFAAALSASYVAWACKPSIRGFQKAADKMNLHPEQVAVIGDQLFTDILGGNRAGLFTILVEPLSTKEFPTTRISRILEKKLLNKLKAEGMINF